MVHNSDKTSLYGIIALLAYRGVPLGGGPPGGILNIILIARGPHRPKNLILSLVRKKIRGVLR